MLLLALQLGALRGRIGAVVTSLGHVKVCLLGWLLLSAVATASVYCEVNSEKSSASTEKIDQLIVKLGDSDFKVREEASSELRRIGKPALEALHKAEKLDDPEIRTRAESLIKRIERRPPPGGARDGNTVVRSIRAYVENGDRVVDVSESRRTIQIRQGFRGVKMTVTGEEDGKEITETYNAANSEELKKNYPEAFELFDQWSPISGTNLIRNGLLFQGGFVANNGAMFINPLDQVQVLRERLELQMKDADIEAAQRKEIRAILDEVQLARQNTGGNEQERDRQLNKYFDRSDALRQKMAELKLPEPGEELPPPANARLGISLMADPDQGLIVEKVVSGGRAEKLGMLPGDIINKVNGKEVHDVRQLRRAIEEVKKGLTIEGMRDEKKLKLVEEQAK